MRVVEVSVAVENLDAAQEQFLGLGLPPGVTWAEETEPVAARFSSIPLDGMHLSLMENCGSDSSPIARFLQRRGEGIFSLSVEVDHCETAMEQWAKAGVEWVMPEPLELQDQVIRGRNVSLLRGNWTKPSSLCGMVIEIQELIDVPAGAAAEPVAATTGDQRVATILWVDRSKLGGVADGDVELLLEFGSDAQESLTIRDADLYPGACRGDRVVVDGARIDHYPLPPAPAVEIEHQESEQ